MVTGLHHAQITIPRGLEDEARSFYCSMLGFQEVPKPESLIGRGGFWMKAGDFDIHVGVEDGVDRSKTKAHVAYAVTDLDYWRQLLSKAGVEILDGIPIPGFERFEFRDPFANRVEMIQAIG